MKLPGQAEEWPIARLIPYARNARTHSDAQIKQIAASMSEFGWTIPMLVAEDGTIIAGHGRLAAARSLGLETAPVIVATGWSEAQRRAYTLADNKLAENAGWDEALLALELSDLQAFEFDMSATGFADGEVERLLASRAAGLTDPDAVPETPAQPASQTGDLWLCGDHRVLCGDSTHADDVKLAAAGERVQMVFTDPPYGVDYTGGMKKRERLKDDHVGTGIYAASLAHLAVVADDKAALYLWYADAHAAAAAAAAAGYQIVAQIIWAKNHAQFLTSAHYKGKHEPCFYAHRKGKSARWHGPNNEVTLWECDRSPRNDFHPTQKPVALAVRAINNSTAHGEWVLDMFLGGGTTLIAAEMSGRVCAALEINPAYVDVCVERWQAFTGKSATLAGDGRSFAEIKTARFSA